MDNLVPSHFLVSLEISLSEPVPPAHYRLSCQGLQTTSPLPSRCPPLNTFGRLGPCTPFRPS